MSNRRCPTCGEEYSDTYRSCPFCEEERAIQRGRPIHRQGGRRVEKRQPSSGGAGGVMLLLCALIIVGVLAYVFFGDDVADAVGIRTDPAPSADTVDLPPAADPVTPADDVPTTPVSDPEPDASNAPPEPSTDPVPLALNQSSITIRVGDKGRLDFIGGTGEVTWTSSNDQIASVENGTITGVAGGTVTITATSGEETAECQVKVEGDPWVNPNAANLSLNKTDFTFPSGETVTLRVRGTESAVTWSSANTSVATVDENGVVRWVGKGTTTVKAEVDGVTLECIVRAK